MRNLICAFLFVAIPLNGAFSQDKPAQKKLPVIATQKKGERPILRHKVVKKTFKDGGKVHALKLVRLKSGPHLVRTGIDAKGVLRTEYIPLEKSGFQLKPVVPVKIKVCWNPTCIEEDFEEMGEDEQSWPFDWWDVEVSFDPNTCLLEEQENTCRCSKTDTECIFGLDNSLELHDFVFTQN